MRFHCHLQQRPVHPALPERCAGQKGVADIVVVDNASTDGTAAILEEFGGRISVIWNRRNVGFAEAQNQAIRASRGGWVLTLNPDVLMGRISCAVWWMRGSWTAGPGRYAANCSPSARVPAASGTADRFHRDVFYARHAPLRPRLA